MDEKVVSFIVFGVYDFIDFYAIDFVFFLWELFFVGVIFGYNYSFDMYNIVVIKMIIIRIMGYDNGLVVVGYVL